MVIDGPHYLSSGRSAEPSHRWAAIQLTFVAISGSSTPPILLTGGSIFSTKTRSNNGSKRFAMALMSGLPESLDPQPDDSVAC